MIFFIISTINRATLSHSSLFLFVSHWFENFITHTLLSFQTGVISDTYSVNEEITVSKLKKSVFVLYDTKH